MKKTFIIFLIYITSVNVSFSQNKSSFKTFNNDDFEKNKVFDQVYNIWEGRDNWFSESKDTATYFVDDRNYKGIINYGVTFRSKNYRNFHFREHLSMCFIKVEISKCTYNPKDNTVDIEGFISGNDDWSNEFIKRKKIKSYINIFIGEKTDTIKTCYLSKIVNRDSVEVKLNNKDTDEFTVLDKFPAFYFKKYSHSTALLGNRQPFKIKGEVTKNTLLVFGGGAFYSEIFDLGTMINYPEKNKHKK